MTSTSTPQGNRLTLKHIGGREPRDVGPNWEQYEVLSPEPGVGRFELFGKDVDPGGEPVSVLATTDRSRMFRPSRRSPPSKTPTAR